MKTSLRYMHALSAMFALLLLSTAAFAADPGAPFPATSEASDQKAGSLLFYNVYTSSATNSNTTNTKVNITNSDDSRPAFVHLFFVDGSTCTVADSYICLTANQTASFLASDVDPGISGYIVAVATDFNGLPTVHNRLIGDEYVKFATGHSANLGAIAFAKISQEVLTNEEGTLAVLALNGVVYNRAARVLALDSIASRADGNDTLLILNRVGGNLATSAATLGPLFGILYDDAETAYSFTFSGGCQFRGSITNTFPRTAPRVDSILTAGRTGWIKIYSQNPIGILGAAINLNTNAGSKDSAFNGGHNLHHLTLNAAEQLLIPVFPPSC
jgi:hypothetical protein